MCAAFAFVSLAAIDRPAGVRSVPAARRPTVAIVGAGFSGLMTAIHLLRDPHGPRVRLIERRGLFGVGVAYLPGHGDHMLNVRARNMSAFADDPDHFRRWLDAHRDVSAGSAFVTRSRYGQYLQELMREAICQSSADRFLLEADGVASVRRDRQGWRIGLDMGRWFTADAVVLAIGNLPPRIPPGLDLAGANVDGLLGTIFEPDPWAVDLSSFPAEGTVLMLGTGLTAVDVALEIAARRPGIRMFALSRHGLLPRRHAADVEPLPIGAMTGGVSALLRAIRTLARTHDWRMVVDGIRPQVQDIWRGWPEADRARFLRHLRAWWNVHRHRLAPEVAARIDHLTASGQLIVRAGRMLRLDANGEGAMLHWRPRGAAESVDEPVVRIINCTGPNEHLSASADPLIASLYHGAILRADRLRLGADVDDGSRAIAADGQAHDSLFAVGPLARGTFWEITSVPDIRAQAAAVAQAILRLTDTLADQSGRSLAKADSPGRAAAGRTAPAPGSARRSA